MSSYEPVRVTDADLNEDPESAMRDARQRFIAAFPKRADSVGLLLSMVASIGPRGPVAPLVEIVHRTAGLAGSVGFPTVSTHARTLEELLDGADRHLIDSERAIAVFDAMRDGFTDDLASPPSWAFTGHPSSQSRRIMVVEDDEDQREVVAIHLRSAGYTVNLVPAGDQALDAARLFRPDLILLDANLPGIDGYAVCRLLKADPVLAATPVIFATVRAKVDDKAVGLLLGADEYLTKPLDLSELVVRMSVLLDRQAARALPPSGNQGVVMEDVADLDYESFVVVAREQLLRQPTVLGLVRVPEPRLREVFTALRADLRRRDIVACYGHAHLVLLISDMPPAKVAERLSDIVASLGPGPLPPFHVGLASSPAPGARTYESLLADADQAVLSASQRGDATAIAGDRPPAQSAVGAGRGTIVLVADDPGAAGLIAAQLRSAGFEMVLAEDVAQAAAAVGIHRPDVVIIDMMMRGMTGVDVLTRLRDMRERPRMVVLSAQGREQDVTRAFALGANDYLTRPFSPQELLARLERLIGHETTGA